MKHLLKKVVSFVTMAAMMIGYTGSLETEATSIGISYRKYVCDTNELSAAYRLYVNEEDTVPTTYGLVGNDDRQQGGLSGVVQLTGGTRGTGFVVGENIIATAAHLVFDKQTRPASSYYFFTGINVRIYDKNGNYANHTLTVKEIHIDAQYYRQGTDAGPAHDYALLVVEDEKKVLNNCVHFNLGIPYDYYSEDFTDIPLTVSGFPDTVQQIADNNNMYTSTGHTVTETELRAAATTDDRTAKVDSILEDNILCFTADVTQGNSGGPVYLAQKYTLDGDTYNYIYTAIGLVSENGLTNPNDTDEYLFNLAAPMNSARIQFYVNNPNVGSY